MYGYPMLSKEIRAILLSQRLLAYDSFVPLLNVKNFLGVSSNLGIKGLSTLVIKQQWMRCGSYQSSETITLNLITKQTLNYKLC